MPSRPPLVLALLLLGAASSRTQGPEPAQLPGPGQAYTSAATAVLVDVVVRDGKGRPVTDLTATDFSLAEDGVPQTIDSFTRVTRGGGIGVDVAWKTAPRTTIEVGSASADGSAAEGAAARETATIALVFDHLGSETLRLAQRATLDYVPMNGESPSRVGVFATEPGLRMVQPYTTDRGLVRQAVAAVLPSGTSAREAQAERGDQLLERRREIEADAQAAVQDASTVSGAALARNAAEIGVRENELRLLQTELNMIRSFDALERDHQGYDTSRALLTVMRSLAGLPGRKTIVFFSEGLPVSSALSARLDSVIDAANRANITTYAIDANGLRAKSTSTRMQNEMEAFVEERFGQLASGTDRTNGPLTQAFERVEDTLMLDSRTGLARLARETGGFLVEGTNDLASAFRRIDEDTRFHYLLTYSPTNTAFDGRFRAIQVKVARPGTQVFARKGYRASRAPRAPDAGAYEAAAIALLDRGPLPNAFPVHAAAFSFPERTRAGLTPLLVRLHTKELRFATDAQRAAYSAHASVVVRIRDRQGQLVQKLSQEYVLSGAAKDVDAARAGDILFYREIDLAPGVYTMEAIVYDAAARQASARVSTLNVPAALRQGLAMSSLVLVSRAEEVSAPPPPESAPPFYVGRTLLYPNLGEPFRKSASADLPFYFTVYGAETPPKASVHLLRSGQVLAESPIELPTRSGPRVQHVGRFPISALPPGTYELRIRVRSGAEEVASGAFFTVE